MKGSLTIKVPLVITAVLATLALVAPGIALAKSVGYSGLVKFPGESFQFSFSASKTHVGDFSFGYECGPVGAYSPGSADIGGGVGLRHGKFKLNFTDHKPSASGGDPGFHVKITGKISGGVASGTMHVLKDPDLSCDGGPIGHFKATQSVLQA